MESFEGINEFVAVAESQGFTSAAKLLGCSTSHVSRQVARLENRLGSILLARSTRMVNLTEAGEAYYHGVKQLTVGLQQANEQLSSQQYHLSGTLRVSGAGTFAEQFVAPALMKFAQKYPDLNIDMDFNSRMVNFVEDGIDFAIRYGHLDDSSLVARKLTDRNMMAVANPDYLKKHGTPKHPHELIKHSCIIANNDHWQFKGDSHSESIKVKGRWKSNNAHAVIKACENGLGIAYMPKSNFIEAIQSGTLKPILENYCHLNSTSWIVYQNRQFLPMRARLAIDYLIESFKDWQE